MALLFCDSVRHYTTAANGQLKWSTGTITGISATDGRSSGPAIQMGSSNTLLKTVTTSSATVIAGFRVKLASLVAVRLFSFNDGASPQVAVFLKTDGTLQAYKGDLVTTIGSASVNSLLTSTLYYIEVKALIDGAAGTLEVRVNGTSTGWLALTGIDTQATANATADGIGLTGGNSTNYRYFSDIYFCNNSGSYNNDFLGEVNVDSYLPDGAGNYAQLTPSTGSNYTCVDETNPNATDYVSSGTNGHIDTYTFTDMIGNNPQIKAVVNNLWALKSDSGTMYAKSKYRRGGTDYTGSNMTPSTTYTCLQNIYEVDPATSAAWVKGNVNDSEFGVEVSTS